MAFDAASVVATTYYEAFKPTSGNLFYNFFQQSYYMQEQVRAYFRGDYAYSNEVGKLAKESSDKVHSSFRKIVFSAWNPVKGSKSATKLFGKTGYLKLVDMRTRPGKVLKIIWTLTESEAKGKLEKLILSK